MFIGSPEVAIANSTRLSTWSARSGQQAQQRRHAYFDRKIEQSKIPERDDELAEPQACQPYLAAHDRPVMEALRRVRNKVTRPDAFLGKGTTPEIRHYHCSLEPYRPFNFVEHLKV